MLFVLLLTPVTAAYIHIPFCRRRCFYCDFPVSVVGDRLNGHNSGTIHHYLQLLIEELRLTYYGLNHPIGQLQTIFLGGGTPSLLTESQIGQILQTIDQFWGIAVNAEISMEMDPGTFDFHQIKGYHSAGINRVSLGVQAFQSQLLAVSGRTHTVEDIHQSVKYLHQSGLENVSIDLISGLPHQTLEQWQDSLLKAIMLSVPHLSCYDLIVEPQTPFARQYQSGETPLPTDETTAQMYRLTQQQLNLAGYCHYEISNFAQPGYECRHNQTYWKNLPFYGLGMGAASYLEGVRYTRPRTIRGYGEWITQLQAMIHQKPLPISIATHPHTTLDCLLDTLMLGLRLAEGVDLRALELQFGSLVIQKIIDGLTPYCNQNWVVYDYPTHPPLSTGFPIRMRLTDPEGFLFSNTVLTTLFHVLSVK